jgi:hypothetical protein
MRHFETVSVIASLLFVAGCASRPQGYLNYEHVPTVTPYQTNEVANSVYRLGYSFGYEDFMAMHAKRQRQVISDPAEAERDGYLAGVAAAYDVWDRQRQEYWRTNTVPFWGDLK